MQGARPSAEGVAWSAASFLLGWVCRLARPSRSQIQKNGVQGIATPDHCSWHRLLDRHAFSAPFPSTASCETRLPAQAGTVARLPMDAPGTKAFRGGGCQVCPNHGRVSKRPETDELELMMEATQEVLCSGDSLLWDRRLHLEAVSGDRYSRDLWTACPHLRRPQPPNHGGISGSPESCGHRRKVTAEQKSCTPAITESYGISGSRLI